LDPTSPREPSAASSHPGEYYLLDEHKLTDFDIGKEVQASNTFFLIYPLLSKNYAN